jgi:hypothetical protein
MDTENALRDAFQRAVEDVVAQPEPYERVLGLRRRRSRMRLGVAGSAVAAVVAVTLGVGQLMAPAGSGLAQPGASTMTSVLPPTSPGLGVTSVVAASPNHLFATVRQCPHSTPPPVSSNAPVTECPTLVLGSDDNGRTWDVRATAEVSLTSAVDATTLLGWQQHTSPVAGRGLTLSELYAGTNVVSPDGGRHWYPIEMDNTTIASVPAAGFVVCWTPKFGDPCRLWSVDPLTRRAAPLATQPTFSDYTVWLGLSGHSAKGETLWAFSRGSVSVSRNAGKTWQNTTVAPGCGSGQMWHSAGPIAKMACTSWGPLDTTVYQTDDYGVTWSSVALPRPLPFVTEKDQTMGVEFMADGTVVGGLSMREGGLRLWMLSDGGTAWREIRTAGVPQPAQVLQMTPDNGLLLSAASGDDNVYLCADLSHWAKVSVSIR